MTMHMLVGRDITGQGEVEIEASQTPLIYAKNDGTFGVVGQTGKIVAGAKFGIQLETGVAVLRDTFQAGKLQIRVFNRNPLARRVFGSETAAKLMAGAERQFGRYIGVASVLDAGQLDVAITDLTTGQDISISTFGLKDVIDIAQFGNTGEIGIIGFNDKGESILAIPNVENPTAEGSCYLINFGTAFELSKLAMDIVTRSIAAFGIQANGTTHLLTVAYQDVVAAKQRGRTPEFKVGEVALVAPTRGLFAIPGTGGFATVIDGGIHRIDENGNLTTIGRAPEAQNQVRNLVSGDDGRPLALCVNGTGDQFAYAGLSL